MKAYHIRPNYCTVQLSFQNNYKNKIVCVEVIQSSQPNWVMSSTVSLLNHIFTGQAWSSKQLISIVHILTLETYNCPSQFRGRECRRKYFMINLQERMLPTQQGRTSNLLITSRTCIQLSHRGWLEKKQNQKNFEKYPPNKDTL